MFLFRQHKTKQTKEISPHTQGTARAEVVTAGCVAVR